MPYTMLFFMGICLVWVCYLGAQRVGSPTRIFHSPKSTLFRHPVWVRKLNSTTYFPNLGAQISVPNDGMVFGYPIWVTNLGIQIAFPIWVPKFGCRNSVL